MNLLWPLPGILAVRPPPDGMFAGVRKHDLHTGIDLHAPERTLVVSMEPGVIINIQNFTGPDAGSPWWHPTKAILVRGDSGVILYGEVDPFVQVGDPVVSGHILGSILRVLKNDKGRPTSMLHLELYTPETTTCCEQWEPGTQVPLGLLDPWPLVGPFMPSM